MKVTQISYTVKNQIAHRVKERFTLVAELNADDDINQCSEVLRQKANSLLTPNIDDLEHKISNQTYELKRINREIEESIQKWDQLRNFYAAQGIKELVAIPQFKNLLPPTIQGEIVDEKKSR